MGTLVRLQDPVTALADELRERFGVSVDADQAGAALAAEVAFYRDHLHEGTDRARLAELRARCAAVLFAALPDFSELDAVAPEARTATLLALLRFAAFSDARAALGRAREAGARVVVVSNWDVSLAEVLDRVGLAAAVDGVVTSAGVGAAKPDPAIFAAALALAGTRPEECVHVGDSPAEDVAGARAAGIEPVLLRRTGPGRPDGVRTIASLDELRWPMGSRAVSSAG
jgi:putative hydrolase of the HAD superfamily